ncbi:tetratricopeptide repeat protein [Rhizobium sp. RM]|uniref:tetratricopeptide repeat protein n=1 Tax=Rhizobium sp. RM TaxID=2748079 RepID=UPI0015B6996E|nr:tetratricopeptide repeat protein [Rhizobium sp. RM]NWJ24184.1 sel1 repeat family protein [Rhizobium sp. RM]
MFTRAAHLCLSVSLLALSLSAAAFPAFAQSGPATEKNPLARQLEDEAQPTRQGRVLSEEQKDLQPSQGVNVYQRMGAELPALPPEKEFTGKVDEAYGHYQRGEYVQALDKALTRAQNGDATAQTLVAEMMSRGLGIARDEKTAAFWYQQAAEGSDPVAMFKFALILMEGKFVTRDKAKADDFMRRAAEAGNASAQFNWGQILVSENPGAKGLMLALPFYEKSAEQGIADAQYAVSQIYWSVKDVPAEKKAKARDWLMRAAKAGYDTAQVDLGIWLVNGSGGERNLDEGFRWLYGAAQRGNVVAQNKVAHLYIQALGTRPDPVEAAKWYVLSRRAGLKDPSLEDFYLGITDEQQKKAIEAANRFRPM